MQESKNSAAAPVLQLRSLGRLSKPLRIILLIGAVGLSAYLWSLNVKKPAENRKYYIALRKFNIHIGFINSLLENLKGAGKADPELRGILERNGVDELLEFRLDAGKEQEP